jgi:hypothetical protein
MQRRGQSAGPIDAASGARVNFAPRITLAGETKPGCHVHPPYREGTGLVYWQREVQLPAEPTLVLHTGMGAKAPGRSDGVVFQVLVSATGDSSATWSKVFQYHQVQSQWVRHDVSLRPFQNQRVLLRFVADAGPQDNATTDHGSWGDLRLVSGPAPPQLTPAQSIMSWCNDQPLKSYFHFRNLVADSVDLTVTFEGDAPVKIHQMAAYAAPEVVYRVYEHGLVIANLGSQPLSFSLAEAVPGRKFRRLQGSAGQDPETNNGQPVAGSVTIPPRDALFLITQD